MKFSIIIPTFNRCFITLAVVGNIQHLLKNCIVDYEIIVVNDGSTDQTENIFSDIGKYIPNFILVKTNKTQGAYRNPGFARNAGAQKATGDVLCFCDGDIIHLMNPLSEMSNFLKNKNINDFYFTGLHYRLFSNSKLEGPRGLNSDMPHGSWLALSKKNFFDIGGYDERFKIYGNEDQDIVQRLRRKGLSHIILKQNLAMHPLFDGERDTAIESDTLKNIQLDYQRESTIVRNQDTKWGSGQIIDIDTTPIQSTISQSTEVQQINSNEIYQKIDAINLAINAIAESQNLNKKTFNLVNNINQNTVSSINHIFTPKPVDTLRPKSVFKYLTFNTNKIYSDLPDYPGSIKKLDEQADIVILSQLHRQRNVGQYLDKAFISLSKNGQLIVICPFYSNSVGSGNTNSLWNAGYLIYNLILAGFDCKKAKVSTFKNEIQIYVQKSQRTVPNGISLDVLVDYFPFDVYQHFNGNILEVNWN